MDLNNYREDPIRPSLKTKPSANAEGFVEQYNL